MAGLSREEFNFIRDLIRLKVLEPVDGHRLSLENGVISLICSDCDRSPDIYAHQQGIVREQCKDPRIHLLADNGGPLLVAKNSPANKPGRTRSRDLLDSFAFAMDKKGIRTISLTGHVPCGIALEYGIELFRTLALTLCAKTCIKMDLKRFDPKVACFYHVDYGEFAIDPERPLKTYFLNKHRFHALFLQQASFTA